MNKNDIYLNSILLIGPSGAGKTEVAKELSKKTGLEHISLDGIANRDRKNGMRIPDPDNNNVYLLTKVVIGAKEPAVFDFGAGHSIFNNMDKFDKVKTDLLKFKNIILLLPAKDQEESLQIMNDRSTGDISDNYEFLKSPCNYELATNIVYTKDKTSAVLAEEIISLANINKLNKSTNNYLHKQLTIPKM